MKKNIKKVKKTEDTIGRNRIIADFMGVSNMTNREVEEYKNKCEESGEDCIINSYPPENLKYDSSYDWLMPVLEKIESIGYRITISQGCCEISHANSEVMVNVKRSVTSEDSGSFIKLIHKSVASFIKKFVTQ